MQITTHDADATFRVGEAIGKSLRGGEIIELVSDLGGGKTTFVKGLAHGAGVTETVQSPTFMISRVYTAPHFQIHHFDFYRLQEAGVVGAELAELIGDKEVVLAIEWGEIVHGVLPADRITIRFATQSDGSRLLTFAANPSFVYILKDIA